MKTELIEHSPTRKEVRIEIDQAQVTTARARVTANYARQASVPGFRPGRAPENIIKQKFKDEIRQDALRELVPEAVQQAASEHNLQPLGEPEIQFADEDQIKNFGNGDLKLNAQFEVLPDFELGKYQGLELTRRTRPVTDEDVEEVIGNLREAAAALTPIEDRASQAGDTVTVDFKGRYVTPPNQEDITAEDVDVVIGGEGVLEDFSTNLTGVREADVKTFTINYPEDFSAQGLAGNEIEYTATVTAVRVAELPELDDEFAKSLEEENVSTVDELRVEVRKSLEENARVEAEDRLRGEALKQLVEAHQVEMPASLVQYQTRQMFEAAVNDIMQSGANPREMNVDWNAMSERMRERATNDLRTSMLLERVADDENLEASDDEVTAEIEMIAAATRQTPEDVRAYLAQQGGESNMAERLRNRKALDFVIANAQITDGEWQQDEPLTEDQSSTESESSTADTPASSVQATINQPAIERTASSENETDVSDDAKSDTAHEQAKATGGE